MSRNCQQVLSPSFEGRFLVEAGVNSFRNSPTKSGYINQHSEQRVRLSSESFSPSHQSSRSNPDATPVSEKFARRSVDDDEDVDMQPLDLSLRSSKDQQLVQREELVSEGTPVCFVKSCKCNHSEAIASRSPPYSTKEESAVISPKPGVPQCPPQHPDSPFGSQGRTLSPTYNSIVRMSPLSSLCYPPQGPSWTHADSVPYQLISTSNSVLNGGNSPPSLFRPYDDHVVPDNKSFFDENQHLPSSPPKTDDDLDGRLVYMDLDSAVPRFGGDANRNQTFKNIPNFLEVSSRHYGNNETKVQKINDSTQSSQLSQRKGCDSPEKKPEANFIGGVISHTSLEKNLKGSHCSSNPKTSSGSDRANLNVATKEEQMCHQDISSTTSSSYFSKNNNNPLISFGRLPQNSPPFQTQYARSQITPASSCEPRISTASTLNQQSYSTSKFHFNQDIPPDTDSYSGKKTTSSKFSSTIASIPQTQTPTSTSSSSSSSGLAGSKHKIDATHYSVINSQSKHTINNESSTKISLLDFMISKILMERSAETVQSTKPCNVDYICTANGEKKIRLRLVDLMELQVEESLRA